MEAAFKSGATSDEYLRQLYRFMAPREFVASRQELITAGFRPTRIDSWLRHGRLVKIVRSVYAYGRDIETPRAVNRAALLASGPGSALIGRSACEAWGLVETRSALPRLVEVGSDQGQARTFTGLSPALRSTTIKVASRSFQPEDIRNLNGLSVERAALALAEFAANASDPAVRFAFLEACRLRHFGKADLEYCFARLFNRRGVRKLRPYLNLWVPALARTKSVFEGWWLLVWIERGHPMPEVNATIFGFEVDLLWRREGCVLELDGDAFHSDPVQKELDSRKQKHLEANGLEVERLTFKAFEADPVGEVDRVAHRMGFC
jgi:hypothetical protein